jgi:hypothetical protein
LFDNLWDLYKMDWQADFGVKTPKSKKINKILC